MKMNGLSPIICFLGALDDSCLFNEDCLVSEKEITGLTESEPDCGSMLSTRWFAEDAHQS